jgi:hypothetical protein
MMTTPACLLAASAASAAAACCRCRLLPPPPAAAAACCAIFTSDCSCSKKTVHESCDSCPTATSMTLCCCFIKPLLSLFFQLKMAVKK